jgi:hypothetical protein
MNNIDAKVTKAGEGSSLGSDVAVELVEKLEEIVKPKDGFDKKRSFLPDSAWRG